MYHGGLICCNGFDRCYNEVSQIAFSGKSIGDIAIIGNMIPTQMLDSDKTTVLEMDHLGSILDCV